ncbi:MAG TPA: transcriptional coactivator p15/PC4 family protein [Candidatus Poseidoniia archaeon]|nr:transcriptional coactivator p15/PC4 family protein [Candidatus Poseidoniia archaeon]
MSINDDVYEKIILEQEDKEIQYRLVVSTFRDVEYVHIRKYYLDFEGGYKPTKEGVCIPFELNSLSNLFEGLVELLSLSESKTIIQEHFKDLLKDLYD